MQPARFDLPLDSKAEGTPPRERVVHHPSKSRRPHPRISRTTGPPNTQAKAAGLLCGYLGAEQRQTCATDTSTSHHSCGGLASSSSFHSILWSSILRQSPCHIGFWYSSCPVTSHSIRNSRPCVVSTSNSYLIRTRQSGRCSPSTSKQLATRR